MTEYVPYGNREGRPQHDCYLGAACPKATPTQRPEERASQDPVAAIEKRAARLRRGLQPKSDQDHLSFDRHESLVNSHFADFATLINELTELRERNEELERGRKEAKAAIAEAREALQHIAGQRTILIANPYGSFARQALKEDS